MCVTWKPYIGSLSALASLVRSTRSPLSSGLPNAISLIDTCDVCGAACTDWCAAVRQHMYIRDSEHQSSMTGRSIGGQQQNSQHGTHWGMDQHESMRDRV